MNVTIQALRAFQAAAETCSFTRAAERMYLTQPAFSRLMAGLEQEWGVRLFDRSTRKIRLTSEGELCYKRVNQLLKTYELLLSDVERARHGYTGQLNVGFNPLSGPPEFLITALKQLGEAYPGLKVTLVRAYSYDLVERIKSGDLDCALVSEHYISPEDHLAKKPLQPITIYALMYAGHPLADRTSVSLRELSGWPLIFMRDSAPLTRTSALSCFRALELPVVEDPPAYDLQDLIMRVRIGSGVGITSFGDPNRQYSDIRAVPVQELNGNSGESRRVLAWHRDCKNPGLGFLCEMLEKVLTGRKGTGEVLSDI